MPAVRIETIKPATVSRSVDLTGTVTPTRTARIASPVEGPVETYAGLKYMVREGDRVKKGQKLLQIGRNKAAEAQVSAATQALKEQETELKRVEQLVDNGAIPASQLDAARSKYENAKAQLTKALESNEDYSVSAPWDGIGYKVHVTEGDYVAPRAALVEIFDPESLVIQCAIPEAQAVEAVKGMSAQISLDSYPDRTFQAEISRVYPSLDERMRTRTIEVSIAETVKLLPGMFARIKLIVSQIPDALTIPSEAINITTQGKKVVFILKEGKAQRQEVTTGVEQGRRVQIISGLQAGDKVIVSGHESLKDGASVKVIGGADS